MNKEDMEKLMLDIEIIKNILISEGELTPWAKSELEKARNSPDSENVSLEKLELMHRRR